MTEPSTPPDDKPRVPLDKPIEAHGETIRELVFRDPTGGDIARCGNPILGFNPGAESIDNVKFDEPKMNRMIAALAGVPESSVALLSALDWTACAWTIAAFFILPAATRSTSAAN